MPHLAVQQKQELAQVALRCNTVKLVPHVRAVLDVTAFVYQSVWPEAQLLDALVSWHHDEVDIAFDVESQRPHSGMMGAGARDDMVDLDKSLQPEPHASLA